MRQDFFEFEPQFKLFIAGNHTPGLRSVDEAIRRRLRLVPFKVTIPPAERDHTLAEQLAEEWSGILDWMIEGCLEWQRHGLQEPPAVQQATTAYLASEDALGTWMEECCSLDPNTKGSSSALYGSWKSGYQPDPHQRREWFHFGTCRRTYKLSSSVTSARTCFGTALSSS
jgi:putative DNA primase/helicase